MKVLQVWLGTPLLWQLANCQNVPSAPSAEDFLARREPAIAILNDYLYITGGKFAQVVDGEIPIFDNETSGWSSGWPLNDTLSVNLKQSWTNSTVELKVTNQLAPSFNRAAFWSDPQQLTAYLWGGWAVPGTLPEVKELWQFTADDDGGGTWSTPQVANNDEFLSIARTSAASAAACNGKGFYLGGFQSPKTDPWNETNRLLPKSGLVTYDMETRTWDNVSAASDPEANRLGFNNYGTSLYGAAACAENFGPRGLFFPIGGQLSDGLREFSETDNGRFLIDMANLTFYDVKKDKWHTQQTSGAPPPQRDRHCVAGAKGPNGTYEIYVYGGNDFRQPADSRIKSDLYVLSLPGFVWFQANTTSPARSSHSCIVANNRQMIVVGGTGADYGPNLNYTTPDVWAQGLGVLDLPSLSWKHQYDADAESYEPPQAVADWYANGGLNSVEWNGDEVKALFIPSDNERNDETSPSNAPIIGGVVGGVVGAALAVGAVWFFVRRRRRRRRMAASKAMAPLPSSDRDVAGYDPAVSQNYQHYAIELNDSSVPYQKGMAHGPYEMGADDLNNHRLEMGTENTPQELPAR